jgi:soluble lytic murein transglycosylase
MNATASQPTRRARRAQRAAVVRRRRRAAWSLAAVGLLILAAAIVVPHMNDAVDGLRLPLRHEDIIRQQAREKGLDPALIAGVIYAESRFRDGQASSAGALGLMQITPETASEIAHRSGGTAFVVDDLDTPQVNIAYGAFYLRSLLRHYGGDQTLALAAYNAGTGNVDRWLGEARERDERLTVDAIPFAETRAYVRQVDDAQRAYRRSYRAELGL